MKYKSRFTGEYVSAHQYIAEIVVKRKADYEKEVLPFKYWNKKDCKWAKEYKKQVVQAGKLIKKYSSSAIISALDKHSWAFSLMNNKVLDEIKIQQKKLDSIESQPKKEVNKDCIDKEVRKTFKKKGMFGKLS
jgi:N-acetylmuramoyl-L-alanine amidase CwlA